jgi:hypothetical protein
MVGKRVKVAGVAIAIIGLIASLSLWFVANGSGSTKTDAEKHDHQ